MSDSSRISKPKATIIEKGDAKGGEPIKKATPVIAPEDLPDYVVINDNEIPSLQKAVLVKPAAVVAFPLSDEDKNDLDILCAKFDQEDNMVGLAAPQIGIGKKMIIFATPSDPAYKKFRPDLTQTMPRTVWVNAEYKPLTADTHEDYEGCFSVKDLAGSVNRYTRIHVTAKTPDGTDVGMEAEGFLARVIQHEVDHTNGILFTDKAIPQSLMSIEKYRQKRIDAMTAEAEEKQKAEAAKNQEDKKTT